MFVSTFEIAGTLFIFTARRIYAQRSICYGAVSVCPSVCHTGVLCRNNKAHRQEISTAL